MPILLGDLTLRDLDAIRDALSVQSHRALIVEPVEPEEEPTRDEIMALAMEQEERDPLYSRLSRMIYTPTTKNLAERHHLAPVAVVMLKKRDPKP